MSQSKEDCKVLKKKNISINITEIILIKNLNKNHYSLILLGKNATKQKKINNHGF